MDVLTLSIDDSIVVIDVTGKSQTEIADFVERTADMAHENVQHATVEVESLEAVGPGDIADALTQRSEGDVSVSTLFAQSAT